VVSRVSDLGNLARAVAKAPPRFYNRLDTLDAEWAGPRARTEELVSLAIQGLAQFYSAGTFAHTARGVLAGSTRVIRLEGDDLRYAAIAALGLSTVEENIQRQILSGGSAAGLARNLLKLADRSSDSGAIALAAWAAAEVADTYEPKLFQKLIALLAGQRPIETVVCSWALSAALAARCKDDALSVCTMAADRLMAAQGKEGLFPHMLPAGASARLRAHVCCFADQVYPIQALARLSVATDNAAALNSASNCAARICALQGSAGQWWWHYDVRNGDVVEGYPVYSVHQHAMAPMALFEFMEAGGTDHRQSIFDGVSWLDRHPEATAELVSDKHGVIWRKIGRREPPKLVRSISAVTTALAPGFRLPGLNMLFPPAHVDYECRPYELGWLLYAWLSGGVVTNLQAMSNHGHDQSR
jgi:hypothetical protein